MLQPDTGGKTPSRRRQTETGNKTEDIGWDERAWKPPGGVRSGNVTDPGVIEAATFAVATSILPFCPSRTVSTVDANVTLAAVRPIIFADIQIVAGLNMLIMLQVDITGCPVSIPYLVEL